MLTPTPKKRRRWWRRKNQNLLLLLGASLFLVGGVIVYTFHKRAADQVIAQTAADSGTEGATPDAGLLQGKQAPPATAAPQGNLPPAATGQAAQPSTPAPDFAEEARKRRWQTYWQLVAQQQQQTAEAQGKALSGDTSVQLQGDAQPGGIVIPGAPGAPGGGLPVAGTDAGAQAEKRAWLGQAGDPFGLNENLPGSLHGMKTDTIMAGTAIQAVILGAINSDMPGMVKAQITHDVFDSAGMEGLPLIPAGTQVIGEYDNSISAGQTRVGIVWTRLIFPDTQSRQLGAMEGADQSGAAGMADKVRKHWLEKFGSAILISIAGAAAQLSQPQPSTQGFYSPTSIGSAAISQQMNQLAQEQARAGMAIPDTIEIRAGNIAVIMTNKDLTLPVWHDQRSTSGAVAQGPILQ